MDAELLSDDESDGDESLSTSSDASDRSDDAHSSLVRRTAPSSSSSSSTSSSSPASAVTTATASKSTAATPDGTHPFDSDECQATRWPIFRKQHVVVRPPAADRTEAELGQLTFAQWLDYYLAHPSFKNQRKYLLSDQQYCLLLDYVTSDIDSIAEFAWQRELDSQQQAWLYHHMSDDTYDYSIAEYKGASVAELDKGPVLVTFKEPADKKGAKRKRRRADSGTARTQGLRRVCVPHTYIERVVHYCHTGGLAGSMHTGQLKTWDKLSALYHGINRTIVRMFVKKCPTCQQQQRRVHKAALVPNTARSLFERVVIDLIDFTNTPSCGYRYILHAVDHFSKYHWAWAMLDKRAATVAYHLNCLLADTGPIKYVQCDQGTEFVAEVLEALADFNCGPMLDSAAYDPQTYGLVERGNGMLKTALDQWFIQEGTLDWYPPLARIRYQLNCNKPRTTRYTPYELVFGKKPPDWAGLNRPWPLRPDMLERVLNPAAAQADVDLSPADPAASILSSMASSQVSTALQQSQPSAHVPLPHSQMPLPESQLPLQESQLPTPAQRWRRRVPAPQLPVPTPATAPRQPRRLPASAPTPPPAPVPRPRSAVQTDIFPNVMHDLAPGVSGPVNQFIADNLNVGCHFVRLGGEGAGRCALSAFYNALYPMEYLHLSSAQRLKRFDDKRKQLRTMWETLNADQRAPSRKKRRDLRQLVADVVFSGNEYAMAARTPEERQQTAWTQLGVDLNRSNVSLGPETIALLAQEHSVNVLMFLSHSEVRDFGARTKQAVDHWRKANEQELRDQLRLRMGKEGGEGCRWMTVESDSSMHLVPSHITQDRPWVVIYQRTTAMWKVRLRDGTQITETVPANGHFEAVVKRTIVDGAPVYAGVYSMGGDTATEYDQVLLVANRLDAYHNQQASSERTAADYDAKAQLTVYQHLDAVGLRIPGKHPRKGNTHHSLPCLVVDVDSRAVSAGTRTVVHSLYTLWCPHGVLTDKVGVDKLVNMSINNFPALLQLRDERLTARQRLAVSDLNWQPPLDALVDEPRITVKNAWEQHRAAYKQRTEDQSRHRLVPTRAAADAAATSIAAGKADARAVLSWQSVTNQLVPLRDSGATSPSRIVRILHANKNQYKVLWSQPEGNPAVTREARSWLDSQAEYMDVVNAWRRKQQEDQDQEQPQDSGADAGTDGDSAADDAGEGVVLSRGLEDDMAEEEEEIVLALQSSGGEGDEDDPFDMSE